MIERTFYSACILTCGVETNCPRGGDSGHGGRTVVEFRNDASVDMWMETGPDTPDVVRLVFGGDCEAEVLAEALVFSGNEIARQIRANGGMSTVGTERQVKIYKNTGAGGNGAFSLTSTATTPEKFLEECAFALDVTMSKLDADREFTLLAVLPHIVQMWAKLSGYKAELVFEKRMLTVGEPDPASHCDLMSE